VPIRGTREIWLHQNQTAFFIAEAHIRGNPVIEARFALACITINIRPALQCCAA
jgi:hypothetical protein